MILIFSWPQHHIAHEQLFGERGHLGRFFLTIVGRGDFPKQPDVIPGSSLKTVQHGHQIECIAQHECQIAGQHLVHPCIADAVLPQQ